MPNKVEYSANNSGGSWWLKDEDWRALERAGWHVRWYRDDPYYSGKLDEDGEGRWLGALASYATREGLPLGQAIAEWEQVTLQDSSALGCSCCGTPHYFTEYDEKGDYVRSYSPDYPASGNRYDE